ncbi:MAG: Spx/MgsR family RNA polymerase-binding regulatory protein [Nodosilinea sp.]
MALTIYGIPTCGTCKKARRWLDQNGVAYRFVDTKTTPPTRAMVVDWVTTLGAKPLRNTSGQSYRALGAEKQVWTDEQWIEAFAADAMLIKRPLITLAGRAVMVGWRGDQAEISKRLGLSTEVIAPQTPAP